MELERDLNRQPVAVGCRCGARGAGVYATDDLAGMVLELAGPFARRDGGGARCLLCGSGDAVGAVGSPAEAPGEGRAPPGPAAG